MTDRLRFGGRLVAPNLAKARFAGFKRDLPLVEPDDVGARGSAVDFAEEAGQRVLGALRLALDGRARR